MTAPPCLNCPDRRIGCHDPAVCPRWAAYDEIHRAELAAVPSRKEWVDIVAWRSTADFVNKFFTKGRMAVVEGRLQLRDWKDKDGNNRRSAEVVAEHVYFGDSKRSESDTASAPPVSGDFREISEDEKGELPF